jgi:hypothetical protein
MHTITTVNLVLQDSDHVKESIRVNYGKKVGRKDLVRALFAQQKSW